MVDAFATYRWDHGRNLWLPVCVQAMVVAVSNHSCWDPGRAFWRSLRHHETAPTRFDIDVDFDGGGTAGDVHTWIHLADDDPQRGAKNMVKAETRAAAKGLRRSTEKRNARAETLGPDDGPQSRKPGSGGAVGLTDAEEYSSRNMGCGCGASGSAAL